MSESLMLKRIQDLVQKSDLSKEDKADFISALSIATDEELENMAALFIESSYWIKVMSDNYKQKKEAASEASEEKWNNIVAQEKTMLQNL